VSQELAVWTVLLSSLCGANLPFLTERLLGIFRWRGEKSLAIRLLEMTFFYAFVGIVGKLLEHHAGQIAPQGWEFYAVTAAMFLTLGFPGFIYRYLLRRRNDRA
jgi:hypothetical protein